MRFLERAGRTWKEVIALFLLLPSLLFAAEIQVPMLEQAKCDQAKDTMQAEIDWLAVYANGLLDTRSQVERLSAQFQIEIKRLRAEVENLKVLTKEKESKQKREKSHEEVDRWTYFSSLVVSDRRVCSNIRRYDKRETKRNLDGSARQHG